MIKKQLIIATLFFSSVGFSQQEKDSIALQEDTQSVIQQRGYSEDLQKKYAGEDFDYGSAEGATQNIIDRFLNWLGDQLGDLFGVDIPPGTLKVIEYIIYALMCALVIYLLVKFFAGEHMGSIFSKKASPLIDINLAEEHIESIDLDALIKEALAQNNYRLAVRYLYLGVLKNLSLHQIIEWRFEKTNSDYEREIKNNTLKPLFHEVSYLYDYIWYGEQRIDQTIFNAAAARFEKLKNSIPN